MREKDQAFIRTCGENGKTYVSRRCSNDYGRYLEFTECGRGGSRGIVVIPEGRKQSGWRGFGKELQLLLLPDGKNGNGLQQVPRQNRSVGDGVETPRYNGELGNRGIATYAGVVGIRKSTKMLDSGPVVLLVSVSDRGSSTELETEEFSQPIPKISAESKIRHPLRFFPNQNPPSQHHKLGKGLIIHIFENGKRRVSWSSQAENEVKTQSRARFHPELPSSLGLHRWVGFLLLTIFGKEGFSLLTGAVCVSLMANLLTICYYTALWLRSYGIWFLLYLGSLG